MRQDVDLSALSQPTRHTLNTIGRAVVAGYTHSEIAEELGVSRHVVRHRLARAKAEIEKQADGPRGCVVCGEAIPWQSRAQRRTCSGRCRVKLHRSRTPA